MNKIHKTIACLTILLLAVWPASAEERLALVIGNGAYESIVALENPVNDALLISERLETAGFEVIKVLDADKAGMIRAISAFGRRMRNLGPETTGLFYYAGHGVQSFGSNYLLPIDAELEDAADLPLVGLDAESVLQQMYSARNGRNIVVLDACRNNPFEQIREFTDNGLAEMRAPTGSFLSYATAPGDVALDGLGGNSPFTRALAESLVVPGLPIEQVFKQVRVSVIEETDGAQTPWDTSSLTEEFYFVETPPEPERPDESMLVEAARTSGSVEAYLEYLRHYPDGIFAEAARSEIAALTKRPVQIAAATPRATAGDLAVTFSTPFPTTEPALAGRSIETLLAGTPMFSPIEGLPEELWKDQSCTNCHKWTRDNFCTQSRVYLEASAVALVDGEHPFGPDFKMALRNWARNDCR